MACTAIQLFTLKGLEEPIWETLGRVGDTTFDGVELYGAHFDVFDDDVTLERTADALAEADLTVAGAHARLGRIEDEFDGVVDACEELGVSRLVVPTYDADAFRSAEGIEVAAGRLADAAAGLAEHGIDLLYHNHTFEFDVVDGEIAFERFVDQVDGRFGFEPDVGLATHAGYDPLELLAVTAGQAPLVHLTDTVPENDDLLHVDVGEGTVNVDACATEAVAKGAEWLVCENGRTDDPFVSLEHGSDAFAETQARAERAVEGQ